MKYKSFRGKPLIYRLKSRNYINLIPLDVDAISPLTPCSLLLLSFLIGIGTLIYVCCEWKISSVNGQHNTTLDSSSFSQDFYLLYRSLEEAWERL
jgi:hypothetical protein